MYRDWTLPACFPDFRAKLEQLHGSLPVHHGMCGSCNFWASTLEMCVRQAIEACRAEHLIMPAEAVIQPTQTLAAIEVRLHDPSPSTPELPATVLFTPRSPT